MTKQVARLEGIIIHPLAFAVFPILSLYAKNMGEGLFREATGIAIGILVFVALLWLLADLFVKNKEKSAILVSAFCVLFFSYGHAISALGLVLERMDILDKAEFIVEDQSSLLVWLAVWGIIFVAVSCFTLKLKTDLRPMTKFLNVVALTLLVMVGANITVGAANMYLMPRLHLGAQSRVDADNPSGDTVDGEGFDLAEFQNSWQQDISPESTDPVSGSLPDIYYIIVDAYARADILKEIYQFDNFEFLSYLAEKGFYVADESRANYPQTQLSLASSLNFMYLDGLAARMGDQSDNRQPLQVMIKNNKTFRFLRNHGYSIFAFSSGYGATEITDADIYMSPPEQWDISEFQEALIMLTPLSILKETRFDVRRSRITYAVAHVADATQVDGPVFVFAHLQAPHWPFIFDADGKPIDPPRGIGMRADYEYDEFIAGYRDQLIGVNGMLRTTIDEILAQSSDPPIIIIQADHGPDARLDYGGWDIEKSYLPERMSILNAYYFPKQDYGSLYESITPVNTFRVVFNDYFGADYELLEDKSYFATWEHPYLFTDVTDEVSVGDED